MGVMAPRPSTCSMKRAPAQELRLAARRAPRSAGRPAGSSAVKPQGIEIAGQQAQGDGVRRSSASRRRSRTSRHRIRPRSAAPPGRAARWWWGRAAGRRSRRSVRMRRNISPRWASARAISAPVRLRPFSMFQIDLRLQQIAMRVEQRLHVGVGQRTQRLRAVAGLAEIRMGLLDDDACCLELAGRGHDECPPLRGRPAAGRDRARRRRASASSRSARPPR